MSQMPKVSYPRYRVHEWLDTRDLRVIYGVQTQREKGESWMHVCNGSTPLFCETREGAEGQILHLRNTDE